MKLHGHAKRLMIFIGETDQYRRRPLYAEIVHRAHKMGLAGASVFRGLEGYGASSLIHTSRLLSLSEDLPVAIVIVDTREQIDAFLPELDEMVTEGLVLVDEVEAHRYIDQRGSRVRSSWWRPWQSAG
ncbi:DUF190 domain-containing protein [Sphaerimonospora thailandensis]|uniref:UPF0166 protein n=1 Tax=Sphaerimonospora thailandensis TaxID=795644 RepID=A0A8J3RBX5_9ACTN|nr:DUF190 domain-containing protein [Sphaerimonospora thailandensis]GIH70989.1 UPF0166 protein [Sphaerimonospora thailandensis]